MRVFLVKLKRFYALLRAFFPSLLPNGEDAFEAYASETITLYGFPDNSSFRHMIASMIQHAPQDKFKMPKRYFYKHMRKAVANEVAFYVMQDIKKADEEKRKALETPKDQHGRTLASNEPLQNGQV